MTTGSIVNKAALVIDSHLSQKRPVNEGVHPVNDA
jgi:hypothetical protein